MATDIKYSLSVLTNFNIQNFLSNNNRTNDSYFWLEGDDIGNTLYFSSTLLNELTDTLEIYDKANQILSIYEGIYKLLDRTRHYNRYFILQEWGKLKESTKSATASLYHFFLAFPSYI